MNKTIICSNGVESTFITCDFCKKILGMKDLGGHIEKKNGDVIWSCKEDICKNNLINSLGEK